MWESRLASLPRMNVSELLCWLEDVGSSQWHGRVDGRHSSSSWQPKNSAGRRSFGSPSSNAVKTGKSSHPPRELNVNMAKAEEWARLPGIGPVLSERAVKFREALGGFSSVAQLYMIYGLDSSVVEANAERWVIDLGAVRPLCLDTASFRTLVRHPLIDGAEARKILRARGKGIESMDHFWQRMRASSAERFRLEPYLSWCRVNDE